MQCVPGICAWYWPGREGPLVAEEEIGARYVHRCRQEQADAGHGKDADFLFSCVVVWMRNACHSIS